MALTSNRKPKFYSPKLEKVIQDVQRTVFVTGQSKYNCTHLAENLKFNFKVKVIDLNQGFSKVLRNKPDALVIDLSANCANALQFCYEIKQNERTSHIPVILTGNRVDDKTKLAALEFGADDCITDLDSYKELIWKIHNHIKLCANLRRNLSKESSRNLNSILPTSDSYLLKRMMKTMEDNIANHSFGVLSFSKELGLSQVQLYRKLVLFTGLTPNEYMRKIRIQRAAELLYLQTGRISEIALQVGFTNLSYFSKCFREQYTFSPSDFARKKWLQADNIKIEKQVGMRVGGGL